MGDLAGVASERAHTPARRGRPRDSTIDGRVLAAAVDELAERGLDSFSVNSVAARAGVAKRGIYARWASRDELVLAALSTLAANLVPPRTGSLRADLLDLAPRVSAVFTEQRLAVLTRCMAEIALYPEMYLAFRRESVDRCMAAIQDAFHEARARGEVPADLDTGLAVDVFLGALLTHHSMVGPAGPPSEDERATYHERLVEFCLAAVLESR